MNRHTSISVLLTCVGGLISPGIIDNLKSIPEISRVVGTDTSSEAIGFHMVDKSYVVPKGDSSDYIATILEIAGREAIDVIIPCSDEEVLSLSLHKDSFQKKGVSILCSSYEITSKAIDKGTMLNFLKQYSLPLPNFFLPKNAHELIKMAQECGYPDKPVVVKPRRGRGGRGFRVLKEEIDILTRDSHEMKLEWFLEIMGQDDHLELVLMEYLPGNDYSIDILADKGRLLFIVPRWRIKSISGPSQIGEVFWDNEIAETVELIVRLFGFDSNINLQFKCSASPDGNPLLYEINPRLSGTIVAGTAAGIDLIREGILHALGYPPSVTPRTIPNSLRMVRYFKEYFVTKRANG